MFSCETRPLGFSWERIGTAPAKGFVSKESALENDSSKWASLVIAILAGRSGQYTSQPAEFDGKPRKIPLADRCICCLCVTTRESFWGAYTLKKMGQPKTRKFVKDGFRWYAR